MQQNASDSPRIFQNPLKQAAPSHSEDSHAIRRAMRVSAHNSHGVSVSRDAAAKLLARKFI